MFLSVIHYDPGSVLGLDAFCICYQILTQVHISWYVLCILIYNQVLGHADTGFPSLCPFLYKYWAVGNREHFLFFYMYMYIYDLGRYYMCPLNWRKAIRKKSLNKEIVGSITCTCLLSVNGQVSVSFRWLILKVKLC